MSTIRSSDYSSARYTLLDNNVSASSLPRASSNHFKHLLARSSWLLTNLTFLRSVQLVFAAWPILTYLFLAVWESIEGPMKEHNPTGVEGPEHLRGLLSNTMRMKMDTNELFVSEPNFLGWGFALAWVEVLYCGYLLSSRVFFPPHNLEGNEFDGGLPPPLPRTQASASADETHVLKQFAISFLDMSFSFANLTLFFVNGIPYFAHICGSGPRGTGPVMFIGDEIYIFVSKLGIARCIEWKILNVISGLMSMVFLLSVGVTVWEQLRNEGLERRIRLLRQDSAREEIGEGRVET